MLLCESANHSKLENVKKLNEEELKRLQHLIIQPNMKLCVMLLALSTQMKEGRKSRLSFGKIPLSCFTLRLLTLNNDWSISWQISKYSKNSRTTLLSYSRKESHNVIFCCHTSVNVHWCSLKLSWANRVLIMWERKGWVFRIIQWSDTFLPFTYRTSPFLLRMESISWIN